MWGLRLKRAAVGRRCVFLFAAVLCSAYVGAAERMVTEVIPVGYRSGEEVAAIIRPLVPPPGSVSSLYNKLIIKTTASNMREIKQVLASIDRAPANLLISVRHVADEEVRRDLAEAFGEIRSGDVTVSTGRQGGGQRGLTVSGSDGNSTAGINVIQSRSSLSSNDAQSVRVLEGKEAFIASGTARPIGHQTTVIQQGRVVTQSGVTYAQADNGFYVRPRLSGDQVTLDIFPSANRFQGSNIQTREAATTVSGRLGRWMEIGGISGSETRSGSEIAGSTSSTRSSGHKIYVKVIRLPE